MTCVKCISMHLARARVNGRQTAPRFRIAGSDSAKQRHCHSEYQREFLHVINSKVHQVATADRNNVKSHVYLLPTYATTFTTDTILATF